MAIQFTQNARTAVLWAQEEAMRLGQSQVEPEHLLLGLMHGDDTCAIRLLDRLGIAASQVRDAVELTGGGPPAETSQLSAVTRQIVEHAHAETEQSGDETVGSEHLLLALLRSRGNRAAEALRKLGLSYERASGELGHLAGEPLSAAEPIHRVPEVRPGFLRGRDLVSIQDLSPEDVHGLFELTREIKSGRMPQNVRGKTLALIFEKPSLRTRVTFSVAMTRLGGQSIYLSPQDIGMGSRESVADVARCMERWVDAIAARTYAHETVTALAGAADIPVVNALTDREHPCQALADFYTVLEKKSETRGMKFAFVGDGNNVAQSLMLLAPRLGTHFTLACPPGYEPVNDIVEQARSLAAAHGTRFEITSDAFEAAADADVLYTDVWTSMGQEEESEKRSRDFAGFQINDELVREAKEDVLVLHCLPAHRGQEIADEVLDGPNAGVWDQAENRLHIQAALLAAVL
uniref:Ornithine carbamoyltransferase n=1 Tax=uncultured Armatimonadetes bacterium TaxID=157466 RepID=A0A6J4K7N8_9BACT|nr:Ornithine carbamoyltransferase [uncultured Armatimonadetes bacterium]